MLDAVITVDQLAAWLRRFHELVIKNQAELTELDSAIGDADHGINMARGMTAVIEKLDEEQPGAHQRPVQNGCHDTGDVAWRSQWAVVQVFPALRRRGRASDRT